MAPPDRKQSQGFPKPSNRVSRANLRERIGTFTLLDQGWPDSRISYAKQSNFSRIPTNGCRGMNDVIVEDFETQELRFV